MRPLTASGIALFVDKLFSILEYLLDSHKENNN